MPIFPLSKWELFLIYTNLIRKALSYMAQVHFKCKENKNFINKNGLHIYKNGVSSKFLIVDFFHHSLNKITLTLKQC